MNSDDLIKLRLHAIADASARSRLAFFIMVVAAGTIVVATYNNYFAWNRIYTDLTRGRIEPTLASPCLASAWSDPLPPDGSRRIEWEVAIRQERDKVCEQSVTLRDETSKEEARRLADNNSISLPWLGITLQSSDLDIFGSIGLFIASMYYLLCEGPMPFLRNLKGGFSAQMVIGFIVALITTVLLVLVGTSIRRYHSEVAASVKSFAREIGE
jgi:hypothetical protein